MTQPLRNGTETPFSGWLRAQSDLDSVTHGLYVTDQDMIVHKYKENLDGQEWRGLQLMQVIEVKTFNANLGANQRQTLFFQHQLTNCKRKKLRCALTKTERAVWHFGCSILRLDGALPGRDQDYVQWGRFGDWGEIEWRSISVDQLRRILRFEDSPDTLQPFRRFARRHHKKTILECVQRAPLGFEYVERIVRRS